MALLPLPHEDFRDILKRIINIQFKIACAASDDDEVSRVLYLERQSDLFDIKGCNSDFGTEEFKFAIKNDQFSIANCIHQILGYNHYLLMDKYGILDAIISELEAGNYSAFQSNHVMFYVSGHHIYSEKEHKDKSINPRIYQEHSSFIMKWYNLSVSRPQIRDDIKISVHYIVDSIFHSDDKLIIEYFAYVILHIMTTYSTSSSYHDILSLIDDITEKILTCSYYCPNIIRRIKNFNFVNPYLDYSPFIESMYNCESLDVWISVLRYFNINGSRLEKILLSSYQEIFSDKIAQYLFDTYEPEFATCDKLKDMILSMSINPDNIDQSPDRSRVSTADTLGPKSALKTC
jgi:hypothetical protein